MLNKDNRINKNQAGYEQENGITLRSATTKDCKDLWKWRNDPGARKYFPNNQYVLYRDHKNWFMASLKNNDRHIFIILKNNIKAGVVRFDIDPMNKSAKIHINLTLEHRNRGIGRIVLKQACQHAFKYLGIDRVIADIKKENQASIKAFTYAGFTFLRYQDSMITLTFSRNLSNISSSEGMLKQNEKSGLKA